MLMGEKQYNKVDDIIIGTYLSNSNQTPLSTTELEWVQSLQSILTQDINTDISTEDFILFFKRRKEKMASSMSGRHLGHHKSITIAAQTGKNILADTIVTIINVAIQSSTPLIRWQHCAQVMLEKGKGNYIEDLRIIQLCKADLNFALHILWGPH
jgi:hypothetical protein